MNNKEPAQAPPSGTETAPLLWIGPKPTYMHAAEIMLQEAGHPLHCVADLGEGLVWLKRHACSLVLAESAASDEGVSLCRQLRRLPQAQTLPLILFMQQIGLQDVVAALQVGVDALLPVPCAPGRIRAQVSQVLAGAEAHGGDPVRLLFGDVHLQTRFDALRSCNLLLSSICHESCCFGVQQQAPPAGEQALQRGASQRNGAPLRLLLAEDNATNRMYLTRLLRKMGHEVAAAEDGQAALELLQRERFDAALLDIQMPILDGVGVLQRIRGGQAGVKADMPLLAVTAHGFVGNREEMLALGFDDYLNKPVDPQDLAAALEVLCTPFPGGENAPAGPAVLERQKTLDRLKDRNFVDRLYTMFVTDLDRRLQAMEAAKDDEDMPGLCKLAHSLKGAAATIDAPATRDKAFALECAAREADSAGSVRCLTELREALAVLAEAMAEYAGPRESHDEERK